MLIGNQLVLQSILEICILKIEFNFSRVLRSGLIDAVVEPVGKQEVSMTAPANVDGLFGVVVNKIIFRRMDLQASRKIARIFAEQG